MTITTITATTMIITTATTISDAATLFPDQEAGLEDAHSDPQVEVSGPSIASGQQ